MHQLDLDGALLMRGFWLYVCQIHTADGRTLHYVGKTGDKSSGSSQSPFDRLSKHLGANKNNNALRRLLESLTIDPQRCRFRLRAFGPLYEAEAGASHADLCDLTSGLEKALADAMKAAGYVVINEVRHRGSIDRERFAPIWEAFTAQFPPPAAMRDTG